MIFAEIRETQQIGLNYKIHSRGDEVQVEGAEKHR